jgi:hypothetical protein
MKGIDQRDNLPRRAGLKPVAGRRFAGPHWS